MKFRVEVVYLDGTNQEQRHTVLTIERAELAMETLGMSLSEGKQRCQGVQDVVIAQQAREYLQQQRACSDCGRLFTSKDAGTTTVRPSLARCGWRIHAGIAASVKARVHRRFVP